MSHNLSSTPHTKGRNTEQNISEMNNRIPIITMKKPIIIAITPYFDARLSSSFLKNAFIDTKMAETAKGIIMEKLMPDATSGPVKR